MNLFCRCSWFPSWSG